MTAVRDSFLKLEFFDLTFCKLTSNHPPSVTTVKDDSISVSTTFPHVLCWVPHLGAMVKDLATVVDFRRRDFVRVASADDWMVIDVVSHGGVHFKRELCHGVTSLVGHKVE